MIKAEQVPQEVRSAVEELFDEGLLQGLGLQPEAIAAAALNAWAGMKLCSAFFGDQSIEWPDEHVEKHMSPAIILPLHQEPHE